MPSGLFVITLACLAVMVGCDLIDPEAPPFALRIETDRNRYHAARDSIIPVEIYNTSGDTLYYNGCIGTAVEVLDGWRVADRIGLATCFCLCRRTLAPGQSIPPGISNVSLRAITHHGDWLPTDQTASLHLVYGQIYRDKTWKDPLARQERRSNPFELEWTDGSVR